MANLSKIFRKVPVDVQNRSGYDASFEHLLTQKVGTITPLACIECVPNQKIELGMFGQVALPPMATDFYGRVDYCVEAFWVPGRLLFGGFEDIFTHNTGETVPGIGVVTTTYTPGFTFQYSTTVSPDPIAGPGSLLDYLGFKLGTDTQASGSIVVIRNILPAIGYHLIWQEFYRDSRITNPVLSRRNGAAVAANSQYFVSQLPGATGYTSAGNVNQYVISGLGAQFYDGTYLYNLRQRCYGKDRFTNATLEPQQGNPSILQFAVSGGTGSFTIGSFLAAYGLDQWKRKMNISGRYGDQQFADWGVYPESYFCDRPVFLGSHRFGIYNKSVYQTGNEQLDSVQGTRNPFNNTVGSKYGSPVGVSDGSLVSNFTTTERGYLYVMGTVVPHAVYSTGIDPKFMRYRVGDFANPSFQILGDEPIYTYELSNDAAVAASNPVVFGYTQRFSSYKYNNDQVSGLLRDGQSLDMFALKRSFSTSPQLSTSFLEIPTNALDEVAASSDALPSSFGAWADIYFKLHTSMPLSAYTIPTLGERQDKHTVMVESGGIRL